MDGPGGQFAWSWLVAYLSACQRARHGGGRYRVTGHRDTERSPTGWRWTWERLP